jgi:hypothetical protein
MIILYISHPGRAGAQVRDVRDGSQLYISHPGRAGAQVRDVRHGAQVDTPGHFGALVLEPVRVP